MYGVGVCEREKCFEQDGQNGKRRGEGLAGMEKKKGGQKRLENGKWGVGGRKETAVQLVGKSRKRVAGIDVGHYDELLFSRVG